MNLYNWSTILDAQLSWLEGSLLEGIYSSKI